MGDNPKTSVLTSTTRAMTSKSVVAFRAVVTFGAESDDDDPGLSSGVEHLRMNEKRNI